MRNGRVCIVGAGVGGITAAYALSAIGLDFDWLETGSGIGGLWQYENDSGLSALYASLVTNTSGPNMVLFRYRANDVKQDYLTHSEVAQYLNNFVEAAGLRKRLRTRTTVTEIAPLSRGGFSVIARTRDGNISTEVYDVVVVANGRNWMPWCPSVPGSFSGTAMHAFHYRTPDILDGKRVIVVGFGNTGADISAEASRVARRVVLSTRSGGHLLFRYRNGVPRDLYHRAWLYRLPLVVRRSIASLMARRQALPPKVRFALRCNESQFARPPVINDQIANLIENGRVTVRPGIVGFDGEYVRFSDGSAEHCDVLLWATGYSTSFPFFSRDVMDRNDCFADRYQHIVAVGQPGLYFVGHVSVSGPVFPVLELQGRWVADLIAGRCTLPRADVMARLARSQARTAARIFPAAARGHETVESFAYQHVLEREVTGGRREMKSF